MGKIVFSDIDGTLLNSKHEITQDVYKRQASSRPEIADTCTNMDEYDVIFVGFPIWWYVAPTIINTFLESYDFSNKTVIPFCTSGGSGVGKTDSILHQSCNDLVNWKTCKLLKSNMSDQDILNWINSLNI